VTRSLLERVATLGKPMWVADHAAPRARSRRASGETMRNQLLVALALSFMPAQGWSSSEEPPNRLPSEVEAILAAPDLLQIWSIEPHVEGQPRFMGEKAIGTLTITAAREREALVSALMRGIEETVAVAACFDPRHGIVAKRGTDEVRLLICFACGSMIVELNGEVVDGAPTASFPNDVFDAALVRGGVQLSKDRP